MNLGCQLFLLQLLSRLHFCRPNDLSGSRGTEMASAASNLSKPRSGWTIQTGGLEKLFWSVNGGCCAVLSKGPEIACRSAKFPTLRFGWLWARQNPVLRA